MGSRSSFFSIERIRAPSLADAPDRRSMRALEQTSFLFLKLFVRNYVVMPQAMKPFDLLDCRQRLGRVIVWIGLGSECPSDKRHQPTYPSDTRRYDVYPSAKYE